MPSGDAELCWKEQCLSFAALVQTAYVHLPGLLVLHPVLKVSEAWLLTFRGLKITPSQQASLGTIP